MKGTMLLMALSVVPTAMATAQTQENDKSDVRRSVVRVFATQRWPDLLRPWRKLTPERVSGSGVVIGDRKVVCNAHLVIYVGKIDQVDQIEVQPFDVVQKFPAKLVALAEEMDLALLEVAAPTFRQPPARMGAALPKVNDKVSTYGFSAGGFGLATTQGVVSRIEYGTLGLRIAVTTAPNPGFSGGPAVVGDKMVGMVFGAAVPGQNVGYLIPVEEIQAFLKDSADGVYDGRLKLLDGLQTLENEALRAKLGVAPNTTGVLVRDPYGSDRAYPLKKGDVITRIGEQEIDNLGMVRIEEDLRLPFLYLVPKLAQKDGVGLTVLRGGETGDVVLPLKRKQGFVIRGLEGTYPSYFVFGPLVFSAASEELVNGLAPYLSEAWSLRNSPLLRRRSDRPAFPDEQLVVVTSVLEDNSMKGYGNPAGQVVTRLNGKPVRNLRHLVEMLRDGKEQYVEVEFAEKYVETLVFDRQKVLRAWKRLLRENGIPEPASADLRDVWQPEGL